MKYSVPNAADARHGDAGNGPTPMGRGIKAPDTPAYTLESRSEA